MDETTAIPPDRFGKDHWSTFAYAETCCVDGQGSVGRLDTRRMRTDRDRHPLHAHVYSAGDRKYPTRLKGGALENHDDWDCLDDLEVAGLLEVISLTNGCVRMTPLGMDVAGELRRHKAAGGVFAEFVWDPLCAP